MGNHFGGNESDSFYAAIKSLEKKANNGEPPLIKSRPLGQTAGIIYHPQLLKIYSDYWNKLYNWVTSQYQVTKIININDTDTASGCDVLYWALPGSYYKDPTGDLSIYPKINMKSLDQVITLKPVICFDIAAISMYDFLFSELGKNDFVLEKSNLDKMVNLYFSPTEDSVAKCYYNSEYILNVEQSAVLVLEDGKGVLWHFKEYKLVLSMVNPFYGEYNYSQFLNI